MRKLLSTWRFLVFAAPLVFAGTAQAGIDDYLHPARAQPRDPDQLIGEYRLTNATP